MVKKIAAFLLVILAAFAILVVSLFRSPGRAFGQQKADAISIDYELPYPGVLPGQFTYGLKMARDKIWLGLTTDPLQKTKLYLLFADKRLAAAQQLMIKNKYSLAVETASKAEKYLEKADIQLGKANDKDFTVKNRLKKAAIKHLEALGTIEKGLQSEDDKKTVVELENYPQQILSKLSLPN